MRTILALLLFSVPAVAATPELELQGGWFHGSDFSLDPAPPSSPLAAAPTSGT